MKPFNLAAALAGEPISFKGYKSYVHCSKGRKNSYIVECVVNDRVWSLVDITELSECTMWEEPRPTVTLTLPCPLKEPRDGMWFIYYDNAILENQSSINNITYDVKMLEQGCYFASKEDAQMWLNAMKNNRA